MLVSPLHNHPIRWWCEVPFCAHSDGTPTLVVVGCDAYDGTPWPLGLSEYGTRGDAAVRSAWNSAAWGGALTDREIALLCLLGWQSWDCTLWPVMLTTGDDAKFEHCTDVNMEAIC